MNNRGFFRGVRKSGSPEVWESGGLGVRRSGSPDFCPLLLAFCLLLTGCETSFDPFEESDLTFSVMGYLDANADTHFVRVEHLRDSLLLGSLGGINATISLEDLSTGERTVWRDSVFQFGTTVFAHNFWSIQDLLASRRYEFSVSPIEGPRVSTIVAMPDTFELATSPEITCVDLGRDCVDLPFFQLNFLGMERAAALLMIYRYPDFNQAGGCTDLRIHYWEETFEIPSGQGVVINWRDDLRQLEAFWPNIPTPPSFATIDVFVAAGGESWPDFTGIDPETLFLPDAFTNIENGIGFLGGVLSNTIRLYDNEEFCDSREIENPGPGIQGPGVRRSGSPEVRKSGSPEVRESRGPGVPLNSSTVRISS